MEELLSGERSNETFLYIADDPYIKELTTVSMSVFLPPHVLYSQGRGSLALSGRIPCASKHTRKIFLPRRRCIKARGEI